MLTVECNPSLQWLSKALCSGMSTHLTSHKLLLLPPVGPGGAQVQSVLDSSQLTNIPWALHRVGVPWEGTPPWW